MDHKFLDADCHDISDKHARVIVLLIVAMPALTIAADWTQWRGPERTGLSKETGLAQRWPVHNNQVFSSSAYGTGGGLVKLAKTGNGITAEEVYFEKKMANHHGGIVLFDVFLYGFISATCNTLHAMTSKLSNTRIEVTLELTKQFRWMHLAFFGCARQQSSRYRLQ